MSIILCCWNGQLKAKSRGVPTILKITREIRFSQKLLQSQIQLGRAHPI
ncbi:hypothetical protein LEP1GSC168_0779 [Leptospira santarosai str. HAI134]|nr:hypothetical protein LEP1GSC168_0779 [Leptospira santarosai str. HAI134]